MLLAGGQAAQAGDHGGNDADDGDDRQQFDQGEGGFRRFINLCFVPHVHDIPFSDRTSTLCSRISCSILSLSHCFIML